MANDIVELFTRVWTNLIERTEGPMSLRFVLQPTMSLIFAIKAAIKDSKNNTAPYLWRFASSKDNRHEIAKEGWKDFGKIFIIGTILDIIYQLVVIFGLKSQSSFYPLESLIVAFILAIVPYLLFRGPLNRLIRLFIKDKQKA
jgi:hypothetical protein